MHVHRLGDGLQAESKRTSNCDRLFLHDSIQEVDPWELEPVWSSLPDMSSVVSFGQSTCLRGRPVEQTRIRERNATLLASSVHVNQPLLDHSTFLADRQRIRDEDTVMPLNAIDSLGEIATTDHEDQRRPVHLWEAREIVV